MALTPADIHNVVFKRPKPLKRGYDEDEVDEFLDQVEAELARLIEENNDLKRQVHELEIRGPGASAAANAPDAFVGTTLTTDSGPTADAVAANGHEEATQIIDAVPAYQGPGALPARPAPSTPAEAEPVEASANGPQPGADHGPDEDMRALSVLAFARETADRHLSAATAEAERQRREAREEAEQHRRQAKEEAEQHRREAKEEAAAARRQAHEDVERMIREATERAEALHGEASIKAARLQRDAEERARLLTTEAERKHSEVLSNLETTRGALQAKVDSLRAFEARFRGRMHSYLEQQLQALNDSEPFEPAAKPDALDDSLTGDGDTGESAVVAGAEREGATTPGSGG